MISRSSLSTLRSGLYLSEWLLFNNIGRSSRILVSGSRFTSAATESDSSTNTESNASKTTEGGDASELESKLLEKDKLIEEKDKLLKEIQVGIWFSIYVVWFCSRTIHPRISIKLHNLQKNF